MSTTLGIYSKMLSIATLSKESNSKQESLKYGNNNEFLYFDKKYLVFEIPFSTNVKTDYTNPLINFRITYHDNDKNLKEIKAYDGSKQLDEWDSNLIRVNINKQGNYGVFQAILEAPKDCTKLATVYLKMTKKAVFNTYDPTEISYSLEDYTAQANAWDNTYNFELVTSLTCNEKGISSSGTQNKLRIQTSPKVSCKNYEIEIYGGGNSDKNFSDSYFSNAIKIKVPDMYFLEERIGFKKIWIQIKSDENLIYSEEAVAGTGLEYLNERKFHISIDYENLPDDDSIKFTVEGYLPIETYPILNSGYNNFSSEKNLKWIGTNNIFSEDPNFSSSSELDYVKQLKKEQDGYSLEQGSKFQKKFVFSNPSDKNLFKLTTDTRIDLIEKENNSNKPEVVITSFSINSFDNIKCSYDETVKLNLTFNGGKLTVKPEKEGEDFTKLLDISENTYYLRLYVYVNMDEYYKQYDYKLDLDRNLNPILLDQKAFQVQVSGKNIPILIKKENLKIEFNSSYVYIPFKRNNQNDVSRPKFFVESYVYYSEQDNLSYNDIEKDKNKKLNISEEYSYYDLTGSETSLDKTLFGYIFGTCYYKDGDTKHETEEQLLSTFRLGRTQEFILNDIKENKKILIRGSNITYNFKDNGGDTNDKKDSLYFLQQQYSSLYRGMGEKLVFEFYRENGVMIEDAKIEIKEEGNKFHNFFYEGSLIGFDIKDYNQSLNINKLENCYEIRIKYIVNNETIIKTSIIKDYFDIITTSPVLSLRKKGIIINGQPNEQSEDAQVIYCDYEQNIVFRFYNENKTAFRELSFSYDYPEGKLEEKSINLTSS